AKEQGLISYDDKFIERIMVYKEKDRKSAVDEREEARYGSEMKIKKVEERYNDTMDLCRKAIAQCEEIIYSDNPLKIPNELLE
ncbi:MAG: hypothetical protein AAB895_03090, partial [Patescibacteria group bacterium]